MKSRITISRNETQPKLSERFDAVVSLTTYGDRIRKGNLSKVIDRILFGQTSRIRLKLVVNVMPEDELLFSEEQREYFRRNNVELYVCEKNLRPHLKYFYTMTRYREYPVITVDDDCLYDETLVEDLWNSYADHPDCVSARRCHLMASDKNNFLLPYSKWPKKFTGIKTPTHELFATGVGGVLYPPNILKISDECLDDIYRSITADDVYLKKREQDLGVKVVYCGDNPDSYENLPEWKEGALQLDNNGGGGNDQIIKNLNFKPMVNLYGSRRLNVFMRLCDSIDCVNNNLCKNRRREFGNGKKDVIITCMTEFSNAVCQARMDGFEIILTMIDDGLDRNTVDEIDGILDKNEILYKWTNSNGTGNISSFRTCFDSALRLKDDEYVMFAEDDYLWDRNSLSEIIRFLNMFGENRNDIWLNPTSDIGDSNIITTYENKKVKYGETLPSSKNGTGIWWRQTWHSTSTFVTSVRQLLKHENTFRSMFKGIKLDQYQRNKIYDAERCFTPCGKLMQHYQKSKTMYWFDERNTERETPYRHVVNKNINSVFDDYDFSWFRPSGIYREIVFLWFGEDEPVYAEQTIENFKSVNPGWTIKYIKYSTDQVKQFKSSKDEVLIESVGMLDQFKDYPSQITKVSDIYRRRYLERNIARKIPTVYFDLDCFPISPIEMFFTPGFDRNPVFNEKAKFYGYTFDKLHNLRSDLWFESNMPIIRPIMLMQKDIDRIQPVIQYNSAWYINQTAAGVVDERKHMLQSGNMAYGKIKPFCDPMLTPVEHYYIRNYKKVNKGTIFS